MRETGPTPRASLFRKSLWGFLFASLAIVAASLVWDVLAWPSFHGFLVAFDNFPKPFFDFQFMYYPTAHRILSDPTPIRHFYYPPFFALLLAPLASLPIEEATDVWAVFQVVAALALIALTALYFLRQSRGLSLLCVALTVFSQPVLHNFRWGQVSTPLAAAIFAAALLLERRQLTWSAVLLAGATAVKVYPGLFVLWGIRRREGRWLVLFVLFALLFLFGIPALVLGAGATVNFYRLVGAQLAHDAPFIRRDPNSQNLTKVLLRIFFQGHPEESWRPFFVAATGAVGLFLLVALLRQSRESRSRLWGSSLALLFLSLPLLLATSWPHYFVYLPFCQTVAWAGVEGSRPVRVAQRVLIGSSIVAGSTLFFRLLESSFLYGDNGFIFYSSSGFLALADLLLVATLGWQGLARRD